MRRLTLAAALLALTAPAVLAQTPDAPARGSAAAPVHAEDAVLADIIASDDPRRRQQRPGPAPAPL